MADVSATFESVPGRHGEVFKSAFRTGYDLPVEIWLRSEDRRKVADVRHRLAEALWTDEPAALYLPDDPTRYLMAIVAGGTDLGEITDDCPTTTVTFHVGDPDFYGRRRRMEVSSGDVHLDAGGNPPEGHGEARRRQHVANSERGHGGIRRDRRAHHRRKHHKDRHGHRARDGQREDRARYDRLGLFRNQRAVPPEHRERHRDS